MSDQEYRDSEAAMWGSDQWAAAAARLVLPLEAHRAAHDPELAVRLAEVYARLAQAAAAREQTEALGEHLAELARVIGAADTPLPLWVGADDDQAGGDELSAEQVNDALSLVGAAQELAAVAAWSPLARRQAYAWAMSEHLRASDNDDVPPMPRPAFIAGPPCPGHVGRGAGERCCLCGGVIPAHLRRSPDDPPEHRADCADCAAGRRHVHG